MPLLCVPAKAAPPVTIVSTSGATSALTTCVAESLRGRAVRIAPMSAPDSFEVRLDLATARRTSIVVANAFFRPDIDALFDHDDDPEAQHEAKKALLMLLRVPIETRIFVRRNDRDTCAAIAAWIDARHRVTLRYDRLVQTLP